MLDRRPINRRTFLTNGAAVAGGVAIAAPFHALLAKGPDGQDSRSNSRGRRGCSPDYGPLSPVNDQTTGLPLLLLPKGFEYLTLRLDRRPDVRRRAHAEQPRRHGDVQGTHGSDPARSEPRARRSRDAVHAASRTIRRARGGTTTLEFDTPARRAGRELGEPQRHGPQLRRRSHPLGLVADVRGNDRRPRTRRTA